MPPPTPNRFDLDRLDRMTRLTSGGDIALRSTRGAVDAAERITAVTRLAGRVPRAVDTLRSLSVPTIREQMQSARLNRTAWPTPTAGLSTKELTELMGGSRAAKALRMQAGLGTPSTARAGASVLKAGAFRTISDQGWDRDESARRFFRVDTKPIEDLTRASEEGARGIAEARRARIEREEAMLRELGAMVREMTAMRATVQRAEERERDAEARAQAAETREAAAGARSERRERFMVRLTVASAVFGAIGSVAAVVAIFA